MLHYALTNLDLVAHAQDHFPYGSMHVTILQTVILDPVAMVLLGALSWKKIVHTYQDNAHIATT